ncbi:MAG: transposase [Desulfovibrio sp.]
MKKVYSVGLDIAKNVFQVSPADKHGRQIANKKLRRNQVVSFFANLSSCTIGIEACGSAHYWARTLQDLGHVVKLIQARRVKAFLGGRNKTDAADARAICEALMNPGTRFVSIKTEEQQDLDHVLGRRERKVKEP